MPDMSGYVLKVFYKGNVAPKETVTAKGATEVMHLIPRLLVKHPDCLNISVAAGAIHRFTVDSTGRPVWR